MKVRDAVELARLDVVGAWRHLVHDVSWPELTELERRQLAGPLGAIAQALGAVEVVANELESQESQPVGCGVRPLGRVA